MVTVIKHSIADQQRQVQQQDECAQPTMEDVLAYQCNICFDIASNPILTLCGHLYCWSCMAVWIKTLKLQDEKATCPVCRKECDENKHMIPIYGRGDEDTASDSSIPNRPKAQRPEAITYSVHGYNRTGIVGYPHHSNRGFRISNRNVIVMSSGNQVFPSFTRIDDGMSTPVVIFDIGQLGFVCRLALMIACLNVVIALLN